LQLLGSRCSRSCAVWHRFSSSCLLFAYFDVRPWATARGGTSWNPHAGCECRLRSRQPRPLTVGTGPGGLRQDRPTERVAVLRRPPS
jgi:hypothetical protein